MMYSFNLADVEKKLAHTYAVMQNSEAAQAVRNLAFETYNDSYDLVSVEALHEAYKKELMGKFVSRAALFVSMIR